jgi:VanZ family protein
VSGPGPTATPTAVPPRRLSRLRAVLGVLVLAHLLALYWPRVDLQGPVTWTDKVMHVLLFAVPVLAAHVARVPFLGWVVAVFAVHAPLSEWLQHAVLPDRSGDAWDALADVAGVVLGVTLGVVGRRRGRW